MRRSSAVPLGRAYLAVAALAATTGLAACGADEGDEHVYCGDAEGVIVDDDLCDDDNDGRYFLYAGRYGRGLKPGIKLPGGGVRYLANDASARSRLGLPSSGHVANGTAISGGFGSGKSGRSGG